MGRAATYDVKVTDGRNTVLTHMDLNFSQALGLQKRFRRDMQDAIREDWAYITFTDLESGDRVNIRVSPHTRCIRVHRLARRKAAQPSLFQKAS